MNPAKRQALKAVLRLQATIRLAADAVPRCPECGRERGEGSDRGTLGCKVCATRHGDWRRRQHREARLGG